MSARVYAFIFLLSTLAFQSAFATSDYRECSPRDLTMVEYFPGFPLDQQPQEVCGVFSQSTLNGELHISRLRFNSCEECRAGNKRCVTTCFEKVAKCFVKGAKTSNGQIYFAEFRKYGSNIEDARDSAMQSCTMSPIPHTRSCSLSCCTEQSYEASAWTVCR
ncbi:hypothetical protein D3C87_126050 [compost metagenome]